AQAAIVLRAREGRTAFPCPFTRRVERPNSPIRARRPVVTASTNPARGWKAPAISHHNEGIPMTDKKCYTLDDEGLVAMTDDSTDMEAFTALATGTILLIPDKDSPLGVSLWYGIDPDL